MKTFNNKLLYSIIENEICFLDSYSFKNIRGHSYALSGIGDRNSGNLIFLDLIKLNRDVKHFVHFLKNLTINPSSLFIYCENKAYLRILSPLFERYEFFVPIICTNELPTHAFDTRENVAFIFIGPSSQNFGQKFFSRFLRNNIFLLDKIMFSSNGRNTGFYSVNTDINDIKKLMFFASLIINVLRKK